MVTEGPFHLACCCDDTEPGPDPNPDPDPRNAQITGLVFRDDDGDGVADPGEGGLPGIEIEVDGGYPPDSLPGGGGKDSVYTDKSGTYLKAVVPDTITISVVASSVPSGYTLTTANDVQTASVRAGESLVYDDIGYQPPAGNNTQALGEWGGWSGLFNLEYTQAQITGGWGGWGAEFNLTTDAVAEVDVTAGWGGWDAEAVLSLNGASALGSWGGWGSVSILDIDDERLAGIAISWGGWGSESELQTNLFADIQAGWGGWSAGATLNAEDLLDFGGSWGGWNAEYRLDVFSDCSLCLINDDLVDGWPGSWTGSGIGWQQVATSEGDMIQTASSLQEVSRCFSPTLADPNPAPADLTSSAFSVFTWPVPGNNGQGGIRLELRQGLDWLELYWEQISGSAFLRYKRYIDGLLVYDRPAANITPELDTAGTNEISLTATRSAGNSWAIAARFEGKLNPVQFADNFVGSGDPTDPQRGYLFGRDAYFISASAEVTPCEIEAPISCPDTEPSPIRVEFSRSDLQGGPCEALNNSLLGLTVTLFQTPTPPGFPPGGPGLIWESQEVPGCEQFGPYVWRLYPIVASTDPLEYQWKLTFSGPQAGAFSWKTLPVDYLSFACCDSDVLRYEGGEGAFAGHFEDSNPLLTPDCEVQAPSAVFVWVFQDDNRDAVWSPGEPPLSGIDIRFSYSGGGTAEVSTGPDGSAFAVILPGPVLMEANWTGDLPPTWDNTTNNEVQSLEVAPGEITSFAQVGYAPPEPPPQGSNAGLAGGWGGWGLLAQMGSLAIPQAGVAGDWGGWSTRLDAEQQAVPGSRLQGGWGGFGFSAVASNDVNPIGVQLAGGWGGFGLAAQAAQEAPSEVSGRFEWGGWSAETQHQERLSTDLLGAWGGWGARSDLEDATNQAGLLGGWGGFGWGATLQPVRACVLNFWFDNYPLPPIGTGDWVISPSNIFPETGSPIGGFADIGKCITTGLNVGQLVELETAGNSFTGIFDSDPPLFTAAQYMGLSLWWVPDGADRWPWNDDPGGFFTIELFFRRQPGTLLPEWAAVFTHPAGREEVVISDIMTDTITMSLDMVRTVDRLPEHPDTYRISATIFTGSGQQNWEVDYTGRVYDYLGCGNTFSSNENLDDTSIFQPLSTGMLVSL